MIRSIVSSTLLVLCVVSIQVSAAEIKTEQQKLSYALGAYFSQGVTRQNIDIDVPAFMQAVEDILTQSELKISEEEMQQVLSSYQQKLTTERAAAADSNKTAGEKFLAENKKKEGVVTLPSGLQYKVLKKGDGPSPTVDDNVKVHYHGTHIDGSVFDSSYERGEPVSLGLNQVIKGWQEAVPLMSVGSKYQIYVPADLAYGERGAGGSIGPNETLIFDIELLGIN
ncbi:MAG TPA: FKBP-type peptidyl-prolyl cis-trans isomerase [Gammaproteobacteria bacterium]|nr:FKBP-type peptidyl-prolyl cis-trans isomerase [Gammaproteobacteria bacterium]